MAFLSGLMISEELAAVGASAEIYQASGESGT
jgi:hypothetical protein